MVKSEKQVSIVIPAYNEQASIAQTVVDLRQMLAASNLSDVEIIVVDDGSKDATFATAESAIAGDVNSNIRLIRHQSNRGYGAAIKSGISAARSDLILITDADLTYPVMEIPNFIEQMKTQPVDMLVGARTGQSVHRQYLRLIAKFFLARLVNYVAESRVPDFNSGFRIFRKDIASQYIAILPDAFSFTTTITIAMIRDRYNVVFVPIDYFKRAGASKIHPIKDTLRFARLVINMGLFFAPLKVFMPGAVGMFCAGILIALTTKLLTGKVATVTSLTMAVAGVQLTAFAFLAELINHRTPRSSRILGASEQTN